MNVFPIFIGYSHFPSKFNAFFTAKHNPYAHLARQWCQFALLKTVGAVAHLLMYVQPGNNWFLLNQNFPTKDLAEGYGVAAPVWAVNNLDGGREWPSGSFDFNV